MKEGIQKLNSDKYQSTFNEISSEEIEVAVKTLKSGKAYTLDLISNEMIIHSSSVIKPQMKKKLFNTILRSGHYPNSWCNGYIVPIYKKGDSSDPKNYRGITISSCLRKVFSVILNNRIIEYLNENDLLCQTQIGFRKNNRTSDHVLTLKL